MLAITSFLDTLTLGDVALAAILATLVHEWVLTRLLKSREHD